MNRKISYLLVALVVLDIIDGDFKAVSVLDCIKLVLYVICFILLIRDKRGDNT